MLATFRFKLFLSEAKDFRIWLLYTLEYLGRRKKLQKRWSYHMVFLKKQNKTKTKS